MIRENPSQKEATIRYISEVTLNTNNSFQTKKKQNPLESKEFRLDSWAVKEFGIMNEIMHKKFRVGGRPSFSHKIFINVLLNIGIETCE